MHVRQSTCQNHISIWHGVHMALATAIKLFCFMGSHMCNIWQQLEFVTPLKYNLTYDVPSIINVIAHLCIWLQYTQGTIICQYRLLICFPTKSTNSFLKLLYHVKLLELPLEQHWFQLKFKWLVRECDVFILEN